MPGTRPGMTGFATEPHLRTAISAHPFFICATALIAAM